MSGPARAYGARRALAIVPARLDSTRLERKMLLRESGQYLFEHTVRNVERATSIERVVLATDSSEIATAAESVGVDALLTSPAHRSGTDRVFEAYQRLASDRGEAIDVVVNVQGDEPELPPGDLELLLASFADASVEFATLSTPIVDPAVQSDPSIVKVVCDSNGDALYFSRAPIPARHPASPPDESPRMQRHIGVYAFRPAALARFCSLPPGRLEAVEGLEQLRWLEAGGNIRTLQVAKATAGIDDPHQYASFVARHRARQQMTSAPSAESQS